ncbi:hypothetical protein LWI29_004405 [Acer saccharum]|uniref:Uncharacterized protein n=1 Tax=Acer saccharum TaxID=4024 RepID=A0AA39S665_ACESA|nr:hypothetical protein LWI29_004405 [Acer saccharum]
MCHLLYLGGLVFSDASKLFGISADSVPVISCVISAFVTAVFWATSFAAGLLTVSTASLLSAKAFSRPSTSLISDPARNLFRIACHIQVFALSRWLHCQLSTMNLLGVYYGVFPTSISLGKLGTSSQSWWDQAPCRWSVTLLGLASLLLLFLLLFLSVGITLGKPLQYKEVHQEGLLFHWYQDIIRVTLGPGKRGQWTWKNQPNSDYLIMLGPLFEDLRGPPKYMLTQISGGNHPHKQGDRIIASDDETEDSEGPFIQKLF